MELKDFIKGFASQFDETDESEIQSETNFRELEEWSSLIGMGVMTDIRKKYGVQLSLSDFKSASTVSELYELVKSKM